MNIAFLLESSPFDSLKLYDAYQQAKETLALGNTISVVFLRSNAVLLANPHLAPPADELNISRLWQDLERQYHFPLIACITSCRRRGIHGAPPSFRIAGLAHWFELSQPADTIIQA
jgi:tRNA 2-thiouridine synthesizing protein D